VLLVINFDLQNLFHQLFYKLTLKVASGLPTFSLAFDWPTQIKIPRTATDSNDYDV